MIVRSRRFFFPPDQKALPCSEADALPYLTLADIVKRKSHVEASRSGFTPLCVLLAACSSKPKTAESPATTSGGFLLEPQHNALIPTGDFANNPAAEQFIDKMVSKHGFDRQQLHEILSQAKRLDYVLRLMDRQAPTGLPPTGPNGAWLRYRKQFITPDNVQNGVAFWNQYQGRYSARSRFTAYRRKSSWGLSVLKPAGPRDGENPHS